MSDQNKSDHWSSLASGLGATPPDDDQVESAEDREPESVEPPPQADVEEPIVEHSRPRIAPVEAPPTDWGRLAGDLGLAVPEQPFDAASEQSDPSPPMVDVDEPEYPSEEASDQPHLLEESGEWGQDEEDQQDEDQQDEDQQDEEGQDEEDQDDELAELALDARDGGGFASGVFSDPLDVESDAEEEDLISDTAEVDGLEADVDTVDTEEPPAEKKSGRRRRRRRPRGRKSSDSQTDTPSEPATDEQSDDAIAFVDGEGEDTLETSLVADETESASSDSEEPPPKTKRRRRRRRGSGRKTAPTSEDDQPAEEESPESDEEPEVLSDDTPGRRGRREASRDVDSEEDQEEESGKTARSAHRAIPTWAEAIEGVISANLENHKKSSSGGSSRSRGGRRRGGRDKPANKTN